MKILFCAVVAGVLAICSFAEADFRKDALEAHNKYRAKHHSPPLTQSAELNKIAQRWAETMAKKDDMVHSDRKGENIYKTSSTTISDSAVVKQAIKWWYDEVSKYNFNKPGFKKGIGHFTQVVWKGSKQLGIGVARSSTHTYVCANYDPKGNHGKADAYKANVLKA